jgi:cytidylate kinase
MPRNDSSRPPSGPAIFLTGPIGAGKTTLGSALARALDGAFIDGDVYLMRDRPWYACSRSTARSILAAVTGAAGEGRTAVVAFPMRCIDWLFHRGHLERRGIRMITVSLSASYAATIAAERGRDFAPGEQARIREMIDQGYGRPAFADIALATDRAGVDETLAELVRALHGVGVERLC